MSAATFPHPIRTGRSASRLRPRAAALLAALVSVVVLAAPAPAAAHADLLSSVPAADEVLSASPETIELTFNENVRPIPSSFELRTASSSVPFSVTSPSSERVSLAPSARLADGSYLLLWQVESADGHVVSGTLRFSVGAPSAPPVAAEPGGGIVLDRVLEFLAWAGAVLATAAIMLASARMRLAGAAASLLFSGLRMVDMFDRLGSSAPVTGEFRAALAVSLAALLAMLPLRAAVPHLALVAVAFAAQGWFSGHHRGDDLAALSYVAHFAHLAGALLWSAAVLAVLCSPARAPQASRVATVAVSLLVPASLVLALAMVSFDHPGRWEWTIAVKAAFTLAALAIGAWNHRSLRMPGSSPSALRRRAAVEMCVIAVVAVATASIATATPAAGSRTVSHAQDAPVGSLPERAPAAGESLLLVFDDGTEGRFELSGLAVGSRANGMLFLDLRDGSLPESLEWTLSNESAGISGLSGSFVPMGDHFHAFIDLPAPGVYTVVIAATVDTFTSVSATGSFTVPSPEKEVSS